MLLRRDDFYSMLNSVADIWEENYMLLCDIDSRFGDGDHGVTIRKIANLIKEKLAIWDEETSIGKFIVDLGMSVVEIGGGSAGPLYGTMIGGFGYPIIEKNEIDGKLLVEMFDSSLSEMECITTAKCGDKTMMDALIPAVKSIQGMDGSPIELLKIAVEAAEKGADDSKNMISKFGRARSYGDQTIGTPDAGAVSTSLFFKGLYEGIKK